MINNDQFFNSVMFDMKGENEKKGEEEEEKRPSTETS